MRKKTTSQVDRSSSTAIRKRTRQKPKGQRPLSSKRPSRRALTANPCTTTTTTVPMGEAVSFPSLFNAFVQLIRHTRFTRELKQNKFNFLDRIFSPIVTLWCMIFQRLSHDHTTKAVVSHVFNGGADLLTKKKSCRPSTKIKSMASSAFCKARTRLPIDVLRALPQAHVKSVWDELKENGLWHGLRPLVLDGSLLSARPHPNIVKTFCPSSNNHGQYYWIMVRVVATFCLHTGMVATSALGSFRSSEQALAARQLLKEALGCLYIGDRNFGVRQMVQAILSANGHCLLRMMECRAKRLLPKPSDLHKPGDYLVLWSPSYIDRKHPECDLKPIPARLIVASYHQPGFRTQWIYLVTTLTDSTLYPPEELVKLYGLRWQVEINLRYLKTQMDLHHFECKSADILEKEWLAGLMAYNLVRVIMFAAAKPSSIGPSPISFSDTRRTLLDWMVRLECLSRIEPAFEKLLRWVAQNKLPSRRKPRPAEPRAARHKRAPFPPLCGDRAAARKKQAQINLKS